MDIESEKLCLEEIDHMILDEDKKVNLAHISNNWNVPNKDGEVVLEKWLKKYSGDKKIAKEYLIRGVDLNGNSIITIVQEKNLKKAEKFCPNHTRTLYSIEISSENGKSLNISDKATNKLFLFFQQIECINLKLTSEKRAVKVSQIVIPPVVKKEAEPAKKPSNIFAASASKATGLKDNKKDSNSSNLKDVKVKQEATSPKKNQAASKIAKPAQGKAISSFFAKPSTSSVSKADKSVSEAASKIEKVKIKEEVVESPVDDTKTSNKRPLSTTSDSNDDSKSADKKKSSQSKKIKLEKKGRSRVMQIQDSSDEEDSASKDMPMDTEEEPVVKKEKENKTPSPTKDRTGSSGKKRRVKVKKMVTKTYEDEDGFINTVREMEEVSCSEEEAEPEPVPKKPTAVASASSTKKKVSPPSTGKKQGSILSFFGKK